jgi:hypothetical protein
MAEGRDFESVGSTLAELTPRVDDSSWQRYLDSLAAAADDRRAELGAQTVDDPPEWAVEAFGALIGLIAILLLGGAVVREQRASRVGGPGCGAAGVTATRSSLQLPRHLVVGLVAAGCAGDDGAVEARAEFGQDGVDSADCLP